MFCFGDVTKFREVQNVLFSEYRTNILRKMKEPIPLRSEGKEVISATKTGEFINEGFTQPSPPTHTNKNQSERKLRNKSCYMFLWQPAEGRRNLFLKNTQWRNLLRSMSQIKIKELFLEATQRYFLDALKSVTTNKAGVTCNASLGSGSETEEQLYWSFDN